jgi:hypothetical protein
VNKQWLSYAEEDEAIQNGDYLKKQK